MTQFNIGIDTGGTYTDAVIIDTQNDSVIATAKSITTRGDLSIGIIQSLHKVLAATADKVSHDAIGLVSVSTTLATNALVEGKGSSVGVVLVGFDDTMLQRSELEQALPSARIIRIDGGHKYDGNEQSPLDEEALCAALDEYQGQVDAYAVAGMYSVRNTRHERRVQELIREHTGCPVTASCDLSEALNGPRRALTAAFNARIIALIVALVTSVRAVMADQSIQAPLMIVKGDGSLASADTIMEKPIETILSGPAASVIGANFLSGEKDFIISDIGGTTTDVAIVKNGWPDLNEKGAMIGEHRTMVKAIDMQTIGLGGDSEIAIDYKGRIELQANRVVPVSLIGARWPSVKKALQSSLSIGMGLGVATLFILRPEGFDNTEIPRDLNSADVAFLQAIGEEPVRWSDVVNSVSDRYRVTRMAGRGILQIAGFTPSDAAHVLDRQSQWSREVAELVCLMIGRSYGKISWDESKRDEECRAFAQDVFDAMVAKSTHVIIERLTGCHFAADDPLVSTITRGSNQIMDMLVSLKPAIPLVAVGGPAPVFYGEVGKRLGTDTVIPDNSHVANAVGAAIGRIKVHASVDISSGESGGYHLHCADEVVTVAEPQAALQQADELARKLAVSRAEAMGGQVLSVEVSVERVDIPGMADDKGLISATVSAECVSQPELSV
ncbi:MAG: hydantoinase/oxoprolinase N-terminal domain-containing protein [Thiolinea sp.]